MDRYIINDISITETNSTFKSMIEYELSSTESELMMLEERIEESIETLKQLTPDCDKLDYILAASSGAICGIIDVFLVGKPGETPVGNITDKWFEERTKDFAKLCKWDDSKDNSIRSAIQYLEGKFKVPYDQRGAGDAASYFTNITPTNHHFKSLAHNPTLLGLFFSILDQFSNTSHFVTGGELIALQDADGGFALQGRNVPSKLFCGFVNWFGHLVSDMSGSRGSKGRGMGIPSPFWIWTNDIIAIKSKLKISKTEFDNSLNELAVKIYEQGYDFRFQVAQAIPVFINEMLARLLYSVRRMIKYYSGTQNDNRNISDLWEICKPYGNASVKRILTVAHGTFCLVDAGDAAIRGVSMGMGGFNVTEFFLRLNIVGIGRFGVSLYGEFDRSIRKASEERESLFLVHKRVIIEDYIEGLKCLADTYNDATLVSLTEDLQKSDMYKDAFKKSVALAEKRDVPADRILKNKIDIDKYFSRGNDE